MGLIVKWKWLREALQSGPSIKSKKHKKSSEKPLLSTISQLSDRQVQTKRFCLEINSRDTRQLWSSDIRTIKSAQGCAVGNPNRGKCE
jgi:hypothetical protein